MALKINYLKNVVKSVAFAAADVTNDLLPNVTEFASTNKDFFTQTYAKIRSPRMAVKRSISAFTNSKIYESVDYGIRNIVSDIKSGKLYNKERAEEGEKESMKAFFGDDFDFDFGGNDDDWESAIAKASAEMEAEKASTVTAGEAKIAKTVEGSIGALNMSMVNAIVSTHQSSVKDRRMTAAMAFNQNERLFSGLHSDLAILSGLTKSIYDLHNAVLPNLDKNISSFQTEELKLSTERNAILKEMLELQKAQAKTAYEKTVEDHNRSISSRTPNRFSDITSGGIPDLGSYSQLISKNIKSAIEDVLMFDADTVGSMLKGQLANPLGAALTSVMKSVIPKNITEPLKDLDKTVQGLFGTFIHALNARSNEWDTIGEVLKIFGVGTRIQDRIDTSKYEKGVVAWDGIARKSLVSVIPGYLSRIESALTGEAAVTFDFNNGKWVKASRGKTQMKNLKLDAYRGAADEFLDLLMPALQQRMADYNKTNATDKYVGKRYKEVVDAVNELTSWIGETVENKGNLHEIFDSFSPSEKNQKNLFKHKELFKEVMSSIGKNSRDKYTNSGIMLGMVSRFLSANDELTRTIEALHQDNTSVVTQYEEYRDVMKSIEEKLTGKSYDDATERGGLLHIKDKYGQSVFSYLHNINQELIYIRKYGSSGSGGSLFGPSEADVANRIKKINESLITDAQKDINARKEAESAYSGNQGAHDPGSNSIEREILTLINSGSVGDLRDFGPNIDDDMYSNANKKKRQYLIKLARMSSAERKSEFRHQFTNPDDKDAYSESIFNKFFEKQFLKAHIRTDRDFRSAVAKATESNKNTYEVLDDSSFIGYIKEKLGIKSFNKGLSSLTEEFSKRFSDAIYTADRLIYEAFFNQEIEHDGVKYNGFIDFLVGKTKSAFEKMVDFVKTDVINPLKEKLGIGDDFKDRFKDSLFGMLGSGWNRFAKANRRIWLDPSMEFIMQYQMGRSLLSGLSPREFDRVVARSGTDFFNQLTDDQKKAFIQRRDKAFDDSQIESLTGTLEDVVNGMKAVGIKLEDITKSYEGLTIETDQKKAANKLYKEVMFERQKQSYYKSIGAGKEYSVDELVNELARRSGESVENINRAIDGKSTEDKYKYLQERFVRLSQVQQKFTGTVGIPFSGLGTLTRGETLINARTGQAGFVKKTGVYDTGGDAYHVINTEDTGKLFSAAGVANPFGRKSIAQAQSEENAAAGRFAKSLQGHAEGTAGDKLKDILENTKTRTKDYWNQVKDKEGVSATINTIKQYFPELMAGGAIGAGTSIIFGLAGGPLLGASVGIASTMIAKSEKLQNLLFGQVGEDGERQGGIISKKVQDWVKKYIPDMVDFGIAGGLTSLFLPFGPVTGMMLGGAVGYLKQNQDLRKTLFGYLGLKGDSEDMQKIKKMLPAAAKGAVLGGVATLFGGPFGVLGNAALGSAIGMMTTTDEFKQFIFGRKDPITGKRRGGILPTFGHMLQPLADAGHELKDRIYTALHENIVLPLRDFIKPAIHAIPKMAAWLPKKLNQWIEKGFGVGLDVMIRRALMDPLAKLFKPAAKWTGRIVNWLTKPVKALGAIGRSMSMHDMNNMDGAVYGTAVEREALRTRMGDKTVGSENDLDRIIANANVDTLKDWREKLGQVYKAGSDIMDTRQGFSNQVQDILQGYKSKSGYGLEASVITDIAKAAEKGEYYRIPEILSKGKFVGTNQTLSRQQIQDILQTQGLSDKLIGWQSEEHKRKRVLEERTLLVKDIIKDKRFKHMDFSDPETISKLVAMLDVDIKAREGREDVQAEMSTEISKKVSTITEKLTAGVDLLEKISKGQTMDQRMAEFWAGNNLSRGAAATDKQLANLGARRLANMDRRTREAFLKLSPEAQDVLYARSSPGALREITKGVPIAMAQAASLAMRGSIHAAAGLIDAITFLPRFFSNAEGGRLRDSVPVEFMKALIKTGADLSSAAWGGAVDSIADFANYAATSGIPLVDGIPNWDVPNAAKDQIGAVKSLTSKGAELDKSAIDSINSKSSYNLKLLMTIPSYKHLMRLIVALKKPLTDSDLEYLSKSRLWELNYMAYYILRSQTANESFGLKSIKDLNIETLKKNPYMLERNRLHSMAELIARDKRNFETTGEVGSSARGTLHLQGFAQGTGLLQAGNIASGMSGQDILAAVGSPIQSAIEFTTDVNAVRENLVGSMAKDSKLYKQKFMSYLENTYSGIFYGSTLSMLGGPFGLAGGALLGGITGFLSSTDWFKKAFFGVTGKLFGDKTKTFVNKYFPKTIAGGVIGALTSLTGFGIAGSGGLLGTALLGSVAGIVASTDTFQNLMLGKLGEDGKRHGGLVGLFKNNIFHPLTDSFKGLTDDIIWTGKRIKEGFSKLNLLKEFSFALRFGISNWFKADWQETKMDFSRLFGGPKEALYFGGPKEIKSKTSTSTISKKVTESEDKGTSSSEVKADQSMSEEELLKTTNDTNWARRLLFGILKVDRSINSTLNDSLKALGKKWEGSIFQKALRGLGSYIGRRAGGAWDYAKSFGYFATHPLVYLSHEINRSTRDRFNQDMSTTESSYTDLLKRLERAKLTKDIHGRSAVNQSLYGLVDIESGNIDRVRQAKKLLENLKDLKYTGDEYSGTADQYEKETLRSLQDAGLNLAIQRNVMRMFRDGASAEEITDYIRTAVPYTDDKLNYVTFDNISKNIGYATSYRTKSQSYLDDNLKHVLFRDNEQILKTLGITSAQDINERVINQLFSSTSKATAVGEVNVNKVEALLAENFDKVNNINKIMEIIGGQGIGIKEESVKNLINYMILKLREARGFDREQPGSSFGFIQDGTLIMSEDERKYGAHTADQLLLINNTVLTTQDIERILRENEELEKWKAEREAERRRLVEERDRREAEAKARKAVFGTYGTNEMDERNALGGESSFDSEEAKWLASLSEEERMRYLDAITGPKPESEIDPIIVLLRDILEVNKQLPEYFKLNRETSTDSLIDLKSVLTQTAIDVTKKIDDTNNSLIFISGQVEDILEKANISETINTGIDKLISDLKPSIEEVTSTVRTGIDNFTVSLRPIIGIAEAQRDSIEELTSTVKTSIDNFTVSLRPVIGIMETQRDSISEAKKAIHRTNTLLQEILEKSTPSDVKASITTEGLASEQSLEKILQILEYSHTQLSGINANMSRQKPISVSVSQTENELYSKSLTDILIKQDKQIELLEKLSTEESLKSLISSTNAVHMAIIKLANRSGPITETDKPKTSIDNISDVVNNVIPVKDTVKSLNPLKTDTIKTVLKLKSGRPVGVGYIDRSKGTLSTAKYNEGVTEDEKAEAKQVFYDHLNEFLPGFSLKKSARGTLRLQQHFLGSGLLGGAWNLIKGFFGGNKAVENDPQQKVAGEPPVQPQTSQGVAGGVAVAEDDGDSKRITVIQADGTATVYIKKSDGSKEPDTSDNKTAEWVRRNEREKLNKERMQNLQSKTYGVINKVLDPKKAKKAGSGLLDSIILGGLLAKSGLLPVIGKALKGVGNLLKDHVFPWVFKDAVPWVIKTGMSVVREGIPVLIDVFKSGARQIFVELPGLIKSIAHEIPGLAKSVMEGLEGIWGGNQKTAAVDISKDKADVDSGLTDQSSKKLTNSELQKLIDNAQDGDAVAFDVNGRAAVVKISEDGNRTIELTTNYKTGDRYKTIAARNLFTRVLNPIKGQNLAKVSSWLAEHTPKISKGFGVIKTPVKAGIKAISKGLQYAVNPLQATSDAGWFISKVAAGVKWFFENCPGINSLMAKIGPGIKNMSQRITEWAKSIWAKAVSKYGSDGATKSFLSNFTGFAKYLTIGWSFWDGYASAQTYLEVTDPTPMEMLVCSLAGFLCDATIIPSLLGKEECIKSFIKFINPDFISEERKAKTKKQYEAYVKTGGQYNFNDWLLTRSKTGQAEYNVTKAILNPIEGLTKLGHSIWYNVAGVENDIESDSQQDIGNLLGVYKNVIHWKFSSNLNDNQFLRLYGLYLKAPRTQELNELCRLGFPQAIEIYTRLCMIVGYEITALSPITRDLWDKIYFKYEQVMKDYHPEQADINKFKVLSDTRSVEAGFIPEWISHDKQNRYKQNAQQALEEIQRQTNQGFIGGGTLGRGRFGFGPSYEPRYKPEPTLGHQDHGSSLVSDLSSQIHQEFDGLVDKIQVQSTDATKSLIRSSDEQPPQKVQITGLDKKAQEQMTKTVADGQEEAKKKENQKGIEDIFQSLFGGALIDKLKKFGEKAGKSLLDAKNKWESNTQTDLAKEIGLTSADEYRRAKSIAESENISLDQAAQRVKDDKRHYNHIGAFGTEEEKKPSLLSRIRDKIRSNTIEQKREEEQKSRLAAKMDFNAERDLGWKDPKRFDKQYSWLSKWKDIFGYKGPQLEYNESAKMYLPKYKDLYDQAIEDENRDIMLELPYKLLEFKEKMEKAYEGVKHVVSELSETDEVKQRVDAVKALPGRVMDTIKSITTEKEVKEQEKELHDKTVNAIEQAVGVPTKPDQPTVREAMIQQAQTTMASEIKTAVGTPQIQQPSTVRPQMAKKEPTLKEIMTQTMQNLVTTGIGSLFGMVDSKGKIQTGIQNIKANIQKISSPFGQIIGSFFGIDTSKLKTDKSIFDQKDKKTGMTSPFTSLLGGLFGVDVSKPDKPKIIESKPGSFIGATLGNAIKDGIGSIFQPKEVTMSAMGSFDITNSYIKKFDKKMAKYGRGYTKQNDPRVAGIRYNVKGDSDYQTLGDSGCGPAAAVNVMEYLTGRGKYGRGVGDFLDASNYALQSGYKEVDGGTRPEFFTDYLGQNGLDTSIKSNANDIYSDIAMGKPTILMGQDPRGVSGDTPYGKYAHYVTATGTDANGNIIVQDPESKWDNLLYDPNKLLSKTSMGISASGKFGKGKYGRGSMDENAVLIKNYLKSKGYPDAAIYGMLGNMQQESHLEPKRLEFLFRNENRGKDYYGVDFNQKPAIYEEQFTRAVDSKTIPKKEFIFPASAGHQARRGYGLVQFTSESIKTDLYNNTVEKGISIGDMAAQLDAVDRLLQSSYKKLYATLKNPQVTLEQATEAFLREYERPAKVDSKVPDRIKYAQGWAQKLSGNSSTAMPQSGMATVSPEVAATPYGETEATATSSEAQTGGNWLTKLTNKLDQLLSQALGISSNSISDTTQSGPTGVDSSGQPAQAGQQGAQAPAVGGPGGDAANMVALATREANLTDGTNKENPMGSNNVKYAQWLQKKNPSNIPWCATFVSWIADQAGVPTNVIPKDMCTRTQRPGILKGGGAAVDLKDAAPGDIVYFSKPGNGEGGVPGRYINHVGIVGQNLGNALLTIEGNTSDRVRALRRSFSNSVHVVRPNYPNKGDPSQAGQQGQTGPGVNNVETEDYSSNSKIYGSRQTKVNPRLGKYGRGIFSNIGENIKSRLNSSVQDIFNNSFQGINDIFSKSTQGYQTPGFGGMTSTSTDKTSMQQPGQAQSGVDMSKVTGSQQSSQTQTPQTGIVQSQSSAPQTPQQASSMQVDTSTTSVQPAMNVPVHGASTPEDLPYAPFMKSIIDVLVEVAHNTDELKTMTKILKEKFNVDITPQDVSNAQTPNTVSSKLIRPAQYAAGKFGRGGQNDDGPNGMTPYKGGTNNRQDNRYQSSITSYTDAIEPKNIQNIIDTMNELASA